MCKKIALACASLLVALLLGELAVRVLAPEVGWHIETDTSIGWSSRSYKGFDPAADPHVEGQTRILFLGDSNLAGAGLDDRDARFPIVLGERLGEDFVVRILASGGWGTDQELLAFRQKGKPWAPDLVVLAFTPTNDLGNILSNGTPGKTAKPYFAIHPSTDALELFTAEGALIGALPGEADRRAHESYLYNLIRFRFGRADGAADHEAPAAVDERYLHYGAFRRSDFVGKLIPMRSEERELRWSPQLGANTASAFIAGDFELVNYQWRLLERLLRVLKSDVEALDARLIVMLLPIPFNPADPRTIAGGEYEFEFTTPDGPFTLRAAEPRDRLQAICARAEIEFYDPSAPFIEAVLAAERVEDFWPDPRDTHPSAAGHAVLAEDLQRYLAGRAR